MRRKHFPVLSIASEQNDLKRADSDSLIEETINRLSTVSRKSSRLYNFFSLFDQNHYIVKRINIRPR